MPAFPEDLALARRMADRDAASWEEALRRFSSLIAAAVRSVWRGASEETVSDAAEELLLELLAREAEALRAYEGRAPLGAYLRIVSRRVALRLREAERRHRLAPDQLDALSRRLEPRTGPEWGQEESAALGRALALLPPRQQHVLHALHARGMSHREVARELGCTAKVVATLAWRGRLGLKAMLRKTSGDSAR